MVWAVLFPYHFHHGMAWGTDQKKTIAQESTHSSARSSREKTNSFSRQPLSQGHKSLREILHWVTKFRNPIAKTALRKFPRKSKWTQEQARTRNARTAADPIPPKHMPSLLAPSSPHRTARAPRGAASKAPQILLCLVPGAQQGPGSDRSVPHGSDPVRFSQRSTAGPLPTLCAQVSLTAD